MLHQACGSNSLCAWFKSVSYSRLLTRLLIYFYLSRIFGLGIVFSVHRFSLCNAAYSERIGETAFFCLLLCACLFGYHSLTNRENLSICNCKSFFFCTPLLSRVAFSSLPKIFVHALFIYGSCDTAHIIV